MHRNNKHQGDYDFEKLKAIHEPLKEFVAIGKSGKETIDFSNPLAVKIFNTALLALHYGIDFWQFPHRHLCPPIPGRVEYIHVLHDLLIASGIKKNVHVLDIGTGATCIYPLLGHSQYGWHFTATEIDKNAFENAVKIVKKNNFQAFIELRFQNNWGSILKGVVEPKEKFSASICNPPFFKSSSQADEENKRKLKGIGKQSEAALRNFSGTAKELSYPGGEKAFLHNYLYQSSLFKTNCFWYTSLVSKKDLVKSMTTSLNKVGATEIEIIPMKLGNKVSRVVAWTFLNVEERAKWLN